MDLRRAFVKFGGALSLPEFGEGSVGFLSSVLAALADPTPSLPEVGEGEAITLP
jgi:hypothetical protein